MRSSVINKVLFLLAFGVMLARGFLFTAAMPAVHYALLAGKIALIPVAFVLAIRTPGKPTPVDLMMLVYGLAMAVCCLINHTQLLTITLMALDIFIIWGLCRWFFVRRSVFPLKAVTLILLAFIALNFALLLLRPDGLWRYESSGKMYYLLGGNYNNMGKALFIAVVCNMLLLRFLPLSEVRQRLFYRLAFVLLVLLSGATLWFVGSKTSLIGMLLVLAFGLLMRLTANSRWQTALRALSMVLFIAVYFALQSWAVFRDQQTAAPKTEYFVEHVLKKDMTFTLRTRIWNTSKKLIEQRPVTGYGEHDDKWYQAELGGLTTHNLVLHVLLKGGWMSLSVFIVLLLVVHLRLMRRYGMAAQKHVSRDVGFILLFSVWIYLFMMIFEVYPFNTLSILFIFASYLCYALHENPER